MGKSAISMAIFNSYVKLPEGTYVRMNGWMYLCMIMHKCRYVKPNSGDLIKEKKHRMPFGTAK